MVNEQSVFELLRFDCNSLLGHTVSFFDNKLHRLTLINQNLIGRNQIQKCIYMYTMYFDRSSE